MFGSSHISHHDLQGPVDQAKEVLQGFPAKGIETLWNWLGAVFQLWKSEHGQAPHQGGLLGRGPSPEFFDEAKPYECAGLGISNSIDLALKLCGDSYEPFLKVIETATLERVLAALILKEATPVNAASVFRASELLHKIKEDDNKWVMAQLKKPAAAGFKQKRNLSSGRLKGAAANKKRAEETNGYWRKIASDMVKREPGWTLDDIVVYIQGLPAGKTMKRKRRHPKVLGEGSDVLPAGKTMEEEPYSSRTIKDAIKGIKAKNLKRKGA